MTCDPLVPTFRILNHLVGWDESEQQGVTGLNNSTGIHLASLLDTSHLIDESTLGRWMLPARLARSCNICEWYLITPCPPHSRLLVRNACAPCWIELSQGAKGVLQCAAGLAVAPRRIAVSDIGAQSIFFFTDSGRRQLGKVAFQQPGPIAYAAWHEWLVVDQHRRELRRLDMAGIDLGAFPAALPDVCASTVDRIAVDEECVVWLALKLDEGYTVWKASFTDTEFQQSSANELQRAFAPNSLRTVTSGGFCLADSLADAEQSKADRGACFSWYGRTLETPLRQTSPPVFVQQGQLLTTAIDSGIPRCRWHRVRLDAEVPAGTTLSVAVSTNEEAMPDSQGVAENGWLGFASGRPHPADWQEASLNCRDFLVQQPPGRYMFVRLRLSGDGFQTPRIQRMRLDFPRQTSLNQLPQVFRDDPRAEDFSERFISLFDALLNNTDDVIQRSPALLDSAGVAEEVLPWLGRFLDIAMDPAWDTHHRRHILQAAPQLFRMRGTVDGLRTAIRLVFDVEPVIHEISIERPWSSLGRIRLSNGARLFGPATWRFRIGKSKLSQAPLRSFGNPDRDPLNSLSYRFRVYVPLALDSASLLRLQQLVEAQKPAHAAVAVSGGDSAFVLGQDVRLGINTSFQPYPPSILVGHEAETDAAGIRLGSGSVLSASRTNSNQSMRLSRSAYTELNSVLR
ncbi:MAG: phage tail protein [Pirellulaceae bacterium]